MRLVSVKQKGKEVAAVVTNKGFLPIEAVNHEFDQQWPATIFGLIENGKLNTLKQWFEKKNETGWERCSEHLIESAHADIQPLYRQPRKIWGIGLNYIEHASDLSEKAPNTEPASFMKPDTSIIGPCETIEIPHQSDRTTAEAELGVIIGKKCKDVSEEDASSVVAGFTTIIDMTAEDILRQNPRYLTRAKSFDTFFSFGPQLVTPDEVDDILELEVSTVINGEIHRKNTVSNMTFKPWQLVSFHSKVMTLLPGDIISTGTPGAVVIRDGDVVECHIGGFERLVNPVKDLKV